MSAHQESTSTYRLRIFGSGPDGATPPVGEQVCLVDVLVEADEEPPRHWPPGSLDGVAERFLTIRGSDRIDTGGGFHSTPPGGTSLLFGITVDDSLVRQYNGLRAHWEFVPSSDAKSLSSA